MQFNLQNFYSNLASYGINLLSAIIIIAAGRWLAGKLADLSEKLLIKAKTEATLAYFLKNIVFYGLMVFFTIAALNKLGVQTTSIVAVIGAAGLAIGLSLQGSLSNLASGVIIITFKPFKVGDFIETGGVSGFVAEVQILSTILNTPDNKKIIIPNSKITSDNIINFTETDIRRVDLSFGISYDDSISDARKVLGEVLDGDERILKEPAPVIAVSELADSSVNIICRPWVKTEQYWDVYYDLIEKVKIRLDEEGITIPYPNRTLRIINDHSKAGEASHAKNQP